MTGDEQGRNGHGDQSCACRFAFLEGEDCQGIHTVTGRRTNLSLLTKNVCEFDPIVRIFMKERHGTAQLKYTMLIRSSKMCAKRVKYTVNMTEPVLTFMNMFIRCMHLHITGAECCTKEMVRADAQAHGGPCADLFRRVSARSILVLLPIKAILYLHPSRNRILNITFNRCGKPLGESRGEVFVIDRILALISTRHSQL